MSFTIFVDGSSNLPKYLLEQLDIRVLPCSYNLNGTPGVYDGDVDSFDFHGFYEMLRSGGRMETTLLNTHLFITHWSPELEAGRDVVYVGMSSGISGTIQAARLAAEELSAEFPGKTIRIVDSLGAGFGTGLLACRGADLRADGKSAGETADILEAEVPRMLQFFTVDDLNFLKRTGRVSSATALVGTMLNIKPMLWGDPTGHITACGKHRGRKKVIAAIADEYRKRAVEPEKHRVAISHGDCLADAQALAELVCQIAKPKELIICPHEPFTGSHVGPGMLALFFPGTER